VSLGSAMYNDIPCPMNHVWGAWDDGIHARVHAHSWIMVTVTLVFDRVLDRIHTVFSALTAQSSMYRPLWLVGHLYRWFSQWFNTVCVVNGQPCPGVGKNCPWWWLRFKEADTIKFRVKLVVNRTVQVFLDGLFNFTPKLSQKSSHHRTHLQATNLKLYLSK
jgi:hypothetical protein